MPDDLADLESDFLEALREANRHKERCVRCQHVRSAHDHRSCAFPVPRAFGFEGCSCSGFVDENALCGRCPHPRKHHWTYYGGLDGCDAGIDSPKPSCACNGFIDREELRRELQAKLDALAGQVRYLSTRDEQDALTEAYDRVYDELAALNRLEGKPPPCRTECCADYGTPCPACCKRLGLCPVCFAPMDDGHACPTKPLPMVRLTARASWWRRLLRALFGRTPKPRP